VAFSVRPDDLLLTARFKLSFEGSGTRCPRVESKLACNQRECPPWICVGSFMRRVASFGSAEEMVFGEIATCGRTARRSEGKDNGPELKKAYHHGH